VVTPCLLSPSYCCHSNVLPILRLAPGTPLSSLAQSLHISPAQLIAEIVNESSSLDSTEYLDSSALGMLLLLREHAGGESSNIRISKASPEVKKILEVANFEKLFNI